MWNLCQLLQSKTWNSNPIYNDNIFIYHLRISLLYKWLNERILLFMKVIAKSIKYGYILYFVIYKKALIVEKIFIQSLKIFEKKTLSKIWYLKTLIEINIQSDWWK